MLLSTPNGLQYSANRNMIADAEIMILIRLAWLFVILFLRLRSAVIPKAIKINPNQYPKTIAMIPKAIKTPFKIVL